ncbi:MAG: glycosyltransferase family 4 protein [Gemmatimonadaceae bacterium]
MRIVAINWQDLDNPLGGGAEIHLQEILERLVAFGHEIVLLCGGWTGCPPRGERRGVEIHRVGTRQTFPFHVRSYWERHLRPRSPDLLLEDINKVPLYTTRWGARRVVALVPHLFGATAFQELNPLLATAVWLAERPLARLYRDVPFQAISASTAADLVARGIAPERVVVIPPGVDAAYYTPDPARRTATPTVAYLGRLKKYKGVDLVIRAFARMGRADAVLEIAGAGDHRPALEALVASLDLGSRVRFLGFVTEPEKLALLRRSWAVALASPKEGWGLTNVEAEACGTPVVASDSPGIRESVRHGETGFLVPHGDVAAMAAAFERLAASPALVAEMGAKARAFAESFTWDRCARATEAHLRQVTSHGG